MRMMKTIDKMTDQEIYDLTDEQVDRLIITRCAKEGVRFVVTDATIDAAPSAMLKAEVVHFHGAEVAVVLLAVAGYSILEHDFGAVAHGQLTLA